MLAIRQFAGYILEQRTPDHSTISKTRRLLEYETHLAVFGWAHCYGTDGLGRLFVCGLGNVQIRVAVYANGFNLGLLLRKLVGIGTPRGLQGTAEVVEDDNPFVLIAWKASGRARWRRWRSAVGLRRVNLVA